ncbi:SDR family NAD(P)-dependent oxidoreductase [Pedobacter sp. NJ-S-72]
MEIKGKTILITGGASGIGFEAAKQFMSAGAKVIITGRNQDKLDAAKKLYPELIAMQSDAGNAKDAAALYEQVNSLGGIDILYHNAGVGSPALNLGIANNQILKNAEYEMTVNYLGVIGLNNVFIDMLKSKPEAAIIITTSILSMVPALDEPTYSASKAALSFYTKLLRKNLQILESRVKVFELLPPVVETEMTAKRTDKKLSPENLVKALLSGIKDNQYTIRVGDSKALYYASRFFPSLPSTWLTQRQLIRSLRNKILKKMKAFILNKYSKKLEFAVVPSPIMGDDEVLIEINAAGLNLLDSKIKSGEFKPILPYKLPLILGHDLAGIVVKVGKNAKKFKVGDEVYARPSDFSIGTFAEQIAIDEKDVAYKPKNISMEEAASLPLVALTAWQALVERGGLKKERKKSLSRRVLVAWVQLLFNLPNI